MTDTRNNPGASANAQKSISLPRRYTHPVRVRITQSGDTEDAVSEYHLSAPFSIGYGNQCEVKLPKGDGPDRLFEFAPMANSDAISMPLELAIQKSGYDIFVDGESVSGSSGENDSDSTIEIQPGSLLKILDKKSNQQVELSVETIQKWKRHMKSLYWISGMLLVLLGIIGYTVFLAFQKTEERLEDTEFRIAETETSLSRRNALLEEIITKFDSEQLKMEQSLAEIRKYQNNELAQMRVEFSSQLKSINESAQQALASIEETDKVARERLLEDTRNQVLSLEAEMSDRLITSIDQVKKAQTELYVLNTTRIESLEQESTLFKGILLESQKAVIYVKTSYKVKSTSSGEQREMDHLGTGFTIDPNGLSIAPQHVLTPWLYDENMLAMQALGMVEIVEGSVSYTIWTSEEQVIVADDPEGDKYYTDSAFNSDKTDKGVVVIYSPEPATGPIVLASAFGAISVERPIVGHTDITVLQLIDFDREFDHLSIADSAYEVEPMDEVILVGYPLSRLHDGKSIPQGVKGFVRRQTEDLLELDTALHPGSSGAPILNRDASVIGMAVALINSDTYGVAVSANHLHHAITETRELINGQKEKLMELNCYSGELDGRIDKQMWEASLRADCQVQ